MLFKEREVPPYAEPVSPDDLHEGKEYFLILYIDDEMFIPTVETIIFIGSNLEAEDTGHLYFQDADSYLCRGVRYATAKGSDEGSYYRQLPDQLNAIFDFEHALEQLMRCSLRRNASAPE